MENITSFFNLYIDFLYFQDYDYQLPLHLTFIPTDYKYIMTDEILVKPTFQYLTRLDASFNKKITDISINKLQYLTNLDCSYNPSITGLSIHKLSHLHTLNANNNPSIYDMDLMTLSKLKVLKVAYNTNLTGFFLKNLPQLEELWMYDTLIDPQYLSVKYLPNLRVLNISNCCRFKISDIADLNLRFCVVNNCNIRHGDKLKNGLPVVNNIN